MEHYGTPIIKAADGGCPARALNPQPICSFAPYSGDAVTDTSLNSKHKPGILPEEQQNSVLPNLRDSPFSLTNTVPTERADTGGTEWEQTLRSEPSKEGRVVGAN